MQTTVTLNEAAGNVLTMAERFWKDFDAPKTPYRLLQFSSLLGLFAFSGYFFQYTVTGKIWNYWPFVQTLLSVPDGLARAALQCVFFTVFPVLTALAMQLLSKRRNDEGEWNSNLAVITYSMTPLGLAVLFIGVPFVQRVVTTLAFSMFLYLLYYGYRLYLHRTIIAAVMMSLSVAALFAVIRQIFVYVIGF